MRDLFLIPRGGAVAKGGCPRTGVVKVPSHDRRYEGVLIRASLLALLTSVLLTGCAIMPAACRRTLAPRYQPSNVYQHSPVLDPGIRRVAVLPIPRSRHDDNQVSGAAALDPVFVAELRKRKLFDIVSISAEELRELTGSAAWTADDSLPRDFFEQLQKATGCDAVLFVNLTSYRAYPPLQVGWQVRLVDCGQHHTWWAVDEVFDAGSASVAASAEAYARADLNLPRPLLKDSSVLCSPRRFGQYTADAVVGTLR